MIKFPFFSIPMSCSIDLKVMIVLFLWFPCVIGDKYGEGTI